MALSEEFIDVRGARIELLRVGTGEPLLYLHSSLNEVRRLPFFEDLGRDFTVYVPSHPGFNRSEGYDRIENIGDLAFHYADLLQALSLRSAHVVGLSLGGWIAAELAVHYPERIRRLALVSPLGLRVASHPVPDIFAANGEELRELFFSQPDSPLAKSLVPEAPSPEELEMMIKARQATARVGWNPYLYDLRLAERLYRISAPTLIVRADRDRLISSEHARLYQQGIAQAQLATVGGGHALPLENPQETARLVAGFLKARS